MKLKVWIRSLQIFNAILLRFSLRLRNSPRPWVRHAQRPTTSDSLEKTHQKAKSSMSLNPDPQLHLSLSKLINQVSIIAMSLYRDRTSLKNFVYFHLDISFLVIYIK
jgi:hypothetical protein